MKNWTDDEMDRRAQGCRRPLNQSTHAAINARHYPGTRQICAECDAPTGRCEEDSLCFEDKGPLCEMCYSNALHADRGDNE